MYKRQAEKRARELAQDTAIRVAALETLAALCGGGGCRDTAARACVAEPASLGRAVALLGGGCGGAVARAAATFVVAVAAARVDDCGKALVDAGALGPLAWLLRAPPDAARTRPRRRRRRLVLEAPDGSLEEREAGEDGDRRPTFAGFYEPRHARPEPPSAGLRRHVSVDADACRALALRALAALAPAAAKGAPLSRALEAAAAVRSWSRVDDERSLALAALAAYASAPTWQALVGPGLSALCLLYTSPSPRD